MTVKEKSVARLRNISISENVAEYLAEKGISSATQLAGMTAASLSALLNNVNLEGDTVDNIKKRAGVMKSLVDNYLVTVRGQVSPAYKRLASTNTNNNIINFHEGMESYPEMFGNLDYATDSEFESMLSPAAYLVDLMRYIDDNITQPPNPEDAPLLLKSRRPDIWDIPLNTENTLDEVLYLELVNEILEMKLNAEGKVEPDGTINENDKIEDALLYMAETIFPFNLPFNTPLEKIRKYLEALNADLYEIYHTFHIDTKAQTREYIKLSPEQATYLTAPLANRDSLNLAFGNIKSDSVQPHFTGIDDPANLGSLNNAEIFMNQVGFTKTSQLEDLFYQNIPANLEGYNSNDLLNNLFINKNSGQYHLAYSPAETTGPDWEDENVWEDPSYYSTIQRVVVAGELYLLVRTKNGIDTWKYNTSHNNWIRLTAATPAWSDDAGWYQEQYYSTIQAISADNGISFNGKLYLFGRYTDGIHTWVFNTEDNTWTKINSLLWPQWSDTEGWNAPECYSTIRSAFANSYVFLVGRSHSGIDTWLFDIENDYWLPLLQGPYNPDWSDANGWNMPEYYLTIRLTFADSKLILTGRSKDGILTYAIYFVDGIPLSWLPAVVTLLGGFDPTWDDSSGWNKASQYMTIQLCIVKDMAYMIGFDGKGISIYNMWTIEGALIGWFPLLQLNDIPDWNPADWQDPSNYLTIQARALDNNIAIIGRSSKGLQTWELSLSDFKWTHIIVDSPEWSDPTWAGPSYYTSIHTIDAGDAVFLIGCTKLAIETWRYNSLRQMWVKDVLVKAVIELENGSHNTALTYPVLDRVNRFIRLSAILGWQYADLDWAFIAAGADDITTGSVSGIKDLQWIIATLDLTVWQATSFWHDLKTYGVGTGPVSQAPFDIVFNQPMPFVKGSLLTLNEPAPNLYHPKYLPNPNYQDEPVLWQTDGKSAGSYAVAVRLIGALNLDARNLKALADYLKGTSLYSSPKEVLLTVENLSVLYRYSLLANSLKLSIPELTALLEFLGFTKLLSFDAGKIILIVECNQWMVENKLDIYQLNYICNSVISKTVDTGFDLRKVPDLLKSLSDAATQWYLNARQLEFENLMTEPLSRCFYNTLGHKKYIDDRGIILKNKFKFSKVSDLISCERLPYADLDRLVSVCQVGTQDNATASIISIPFNPNDMPSPQTAWDGSACIWFKYDSSVKGVCTIYSLFDSANNENITSLQVNNGNIVLTVQNQTPQTICKIPGSNQWHFLLISYKQQLVSLDDLPPVTPSPKLVIPVGVTCAIAIGNSSDSFATEVAELRLFDAKITAASIVWQLYNVIEPPSGSLPGNSNYWPLNEGQDAETAKDLDGDINGTYGINTPWRIVYNIGIPDGFKYLNANGSLTQKFDPADNTPGYQPFIDLWKTITALMNILNKMIGIQKNGTLQKLSDYYQLNKDITVYADYIAMEDQYPRYIQTLLAYRFSLSWLEFSLELDRPNPFVSSNLVNQFAANNINISENAGITRLTDDIGNPVDKWLLTESADDLFFLNKREDAMDIYKLLPDGAAKVYPYGYSFADDDEYREYNIDGRSISQKPRLFFSEYNERFAVLFQRNNLIKVVVYEIPGTGNDVVSKIDSFVSDLGQLLFTVKALKLSDAEFACIADNKVRFFSSPGKTGSGLFSLSQLKAILLFKKLNNKYADGDRSFAAYFYMADDMASLVNYVAKLTQWDVQGLRQLSEWNCLYEQFAKIDIAGSINPSVTAVGAGGNKAIVGYPLSNAVFVYRLKGEEWETLPAITQPQPAVSFGAAVTVQNYSDGGKTALRAIVADPGGNDGKGVVYCYQYNDAKKEWSTPVQLIAADGAAGDAFGSAVSIYQNTLAIGAPTKGNAKSGKTYLFKYESGQWKDQGVIFNVPAGDSLFGSSISLNDDIIAIGSENNAYIFRIENSKAVPIVPPVASSGAKVVTNGDFAFISGVSGGNPVINYITDISSPTPSKVQTLKNSELSGVCAIAIENDTFIVLDSSSTCFVYYIQDNLLAFRNTFKLSVLPVSAAQPCPIALHDGNLIAGVNNNNKPVVLFYGTKHDINWFGFADDCFSLADRLGVSIGFLLGFISLAKLEMNVRCASTQMKLPGYNQEVYKSYETYANKLASALTMGRTPEEWNTVYNPLRNKFLERERDALAGYMIFFLRHSFSDIKGINDLYELLLIDVGSSGCRSVSKIKSALNSLQLYIERCMMQLEPYASVKGNTGGTADALNPADVEWSWMSHYRIWEANREVFFFPENYYDPTLRKDRTAQYADLQNKLCQSNLTNSSATDAFQSYFHDLESLTALVIVSVCMGRIASLVNGRIIVKNTFFIFAKTKNRDEGYYFRTADAILPSDKPDTWLNWSNWEKINISIKSNSVTAVYASGRVFLFWLEFTKQQVTGDESTFNSDKSFNYVTKVFYTFQNSNGQWANPHEIPDPGNSLSFVVKYTPSSNRAKEQNGQTDPSNKVDLPASPKIDFLNSFLDIANLSIDFKVTGGTATPPSPLSISVDDILNLYERYMWSFNGNTEDLRSQFSLGTANGATCVNGNDIFSNRQVLELSGYSGGLTLPGHFNTWFNESFTLGLWVNGTFPAGSAGVWPILYAGPPPSPALPDQFCFQIVNGFPTFGVGLQNLSGNTQLQNNTWYFIVFRYNAKTFEQSIFVNGVLDKQEFYPYLLQGNTQFLFGYNHTQSATGYIADMFTIHFPIADTEIFSIYEQYINYEISDDAENYEWELDTGFNEVRGKKNDTLIPSSAGIVFQPANGAPFGNERDALLLTAADKQYVSFPDRFNTFLHHSFSVGIWIYGNFPAAADWPIIASSAFTPGEAFCVLIRNGTAYFDFYNSSTKGNKPISSGVWHFLVFTYEEDSQTQSIFVDGIFDSSTSGHLPYTGSTTLNLGLYNSEYANGQMANLFLVNTALSASEVAAIYSGITNPNSNPVSAGNTDTLNLIQIQNGIRIQQFSEDLFMGGADYLYAKNSVNINASYISSKAAYGKYMWELFYHIPMLVGQLLCSNQKFEDAKHWYEYIFNPTAADKSNDRFWQFGYFRSLGKPEDLVQILTDNSQRNADQILLYNLDPFDPEAIAYLRPGAFEKKTVLNYIRNLLNWGDSLFSQYTWETITQAEMLYVLAKELLGRRPDILGSFTKKTPMTIEEISKEYSGDIPEFVIDIEDRLPLVPPGVQYTPQLSASVSNFYFGIPDNDELPSLQDLVDKRLFEIRNCLNIMGQQQSLALFEPPINPMMLVAAGAAGLSVADVPISYAADIPHFRFTAMIGFAKSVAERVTGFGSQILSALEKNDEELLAMLRITQEKTILDLTTSIKEREIESAMNQALVLDQSLASANERVTYYTSMLAKPVSDLEAMALQFNQIAIDVEVPATELHVAAVVGHLIPTVFGFADGDFSPGGSIESAAAALSSGSGIANNKANMTAVSASYSRRAEDWGLQLKLAQDDVASIGIQKKINDIQLQNTLSELTIQNQNITNNQNLQAFYRNKFTNRELYQWMIDQISSVYYQAFQMALDLAKKAEVTYQFELNTNESYISYGYWDNTRKGLLAGEKLISDLDRLNKAYIDNSRRYLEIQKVVSLKDISITELNKLIQTGTCKISLTEQMYDWDFPGHYNRKIKSVSITIPAIVGPYQSIKATLIQESNKVITRPDLNTVKYLISKDKTPQPSANSLRINWRPNQQIAISKASGDSGMFELNFNDERYLPFEGTGAVSDWQLNIPQATNAFDLSTISDVIMYINYTAEDGGVEFAQQVINLPEIKNYKGVLVVSIKQQFNQAWNTFMTTGSAIFSVQGLQFPPNLKTPVTKDLNHIDMMYRTTTGNDDGIKVTLTFKNPGPDDWKIKYSNADRSELLDIVLEIPYSADLK